MNRRHEDFQSSALPTELSRQAFFRAFINVTREFHFCQGQNENFLEKKEIGNGARKILVLKSRLVGQHSPVAQVRAPP